MVEWKSNPDPSEFANEIGYMKPKIRKRSVIRIFAPTWSTILPSYSEWIVLAWTDHFEMQFHNTTCIFFCQQIYMAIIDTRKKIIARGNIRIGVASHLHCVKICSPCRFQHQKKIGDGIGSKMLTAVAQIQSDCDPHLKILHLCLEPNKWRRCWLQSRMNVNSCQKFLAAQICHSQLLRYATID